MRRPHARWMECRWLRQQQVKGSGMEQLVDGLPLIIGGTGMVAGLVLLITALVTVRRQQARE